MAKLFKDLKENALIREAYYAVSVLAYFFNDTFQFSSITEHNLCPGTHFFAGAAETLPAVIAQILQKHNFHRAASGPGSKKAGGNHTGVIKDKTVPGIQVVREVIEMAVLHFPADFIQHKKTGAVTPGQRRLGNQFLRQIVYKIRCFQCQYTPYCR